VSEARVGRINGKRHRRVHQQSNIASFAAQEFDADLVNTSGDSSVEKFPYKDAKSREVQDRREGLRRGYAANVEQDTYTTAQAARILKVTDRGVRKMIDRGELEARQDERGRHLIPQRAVHAMLEDRRATSPAEATVEGPESAEEARELRERVEGLQRELGRLEGRLELTERTESTMREERERLAQLLEEERAERRRLQEELNTERGKGFWQRLFGG
jgi:excisionase family DNA binding protein